MFSQCQPIHARALAPLQGLILALTFNNATNFKFTFLDTPSVKIVRCPKTQAYIRLLTCIKKYSAKVTSKLPVLISALRVSPPSDGPPHDGKVIGEDSVVYSYDQVHLQSLLTENLSLIVPRYTAHSDSFVFDCNCRWQHPLSPISKVRGQNVDHWRLG